MKKLDRKNIEDVFPMSDIQQGMLFHTMKDDTLTTYHEQNVFSFKEEGFDYGLFQNALDALIQKHAMLRTVFNLFDFKEPVQIILREINPDIDLTNLDNLNDDRQRNEMIKKVLKEDRSQHFSITHQMVLWRIKILLLPDNEICLIWIFHHAIFDGWSTSNFITELHEVYKSLEKDRSYCPSPIKSTYKDFVIEQIANKKSDSLRDFWKSELSGYKRYTANGKTDYNHVEAFKNTYREFDPILLFKLKEQARIYNIELRTICIAAYMYTLKMLTYENDILVGVMSNNRPLVEDSEKILGCFLNALPFRVDFSESSVDSWLELVKAVDRKRGQLIKNDRLSFFEIVKLFKEDTSEQNPFYDVAFDLVDFNAYNELDNYNSRNSKDLALLTFERTNVLFDFEVSLTLNKLQVYINYAFPLWSDEQVERVLSFYNCILTKMAYEADSEIEHEEIFDSSETAFLLNNFTKSEKEPADSLIGTFEGLVQQFSDQIAVADSHISLTYKELNQYANQISSCIRQSEVEEGSLVLMYFQRSAFLLSSMLGILKSGAAFVAIDTDTPDVRVKFILEDSKARIILTDEKEVPRLQSIQKGVENHPKIVVISCSHKIDDRIAQLPDHNPKVKITANQLAYVIYTSGTTGKPKGVMLHHQGLFNHLDAVRKFLQVSQNDIMAQTASCKFDICIMQFLLCTIVGGKTQIVDQEVQLEPDRLLQNLKDAGITLLELVPSHIDAILDITNNNTELLENIRFLISTGELLPEKLVKKWYAVYPNIPIVNAYGPAETSDDVTLHFVTEQDTAPIPVGKPLQNIQVYIIDQNNKLSPRGVIGEIAIAGTAVGKGYWNDPDLTDKSFIKNPFTKTSTEKFGNIYKTGDLGYWNSNGDLVVKGRVGSMVKIRGNRIELGEVESHLDKISGIYRSVVSDKVVNGETVLCAYYVASEKLNLRQVRNQLSNKIPRYMLPSYYIQMDELPVSINGKIDRKSLPLPTDQVMEEPKADLGDIGVTISGIWKDVLSIDSVNVDDNFFDIGGHSLNLIKVNSKLNEIMGTSISIVTLFQFPTIRSLVGYLSENPKTVIAEDSMRESVELIDEAINFFSKD